jgi:hypothetical protein
MVMCMIDFVVTSASDEEYLKTKLYTTIDISSELVTVAIL